MDGSCARQGAVAVVESLGVESRRGDVLDADSFSRAATGSDVIFHTAAAITPSGGWERSAG
jgi:uncharacterized protein YbjT (DUF2867 family)